jgi:hypothetical protein
MLVTRLNALLLYSSEYATLLNEQGITLLCHKKKQEIQIFQIMTKNVLLLGRTETVIDSA